MMLSIVLATHAQEWRETLSMARQAYEQKQYAKAYDYYRRAAKSAPQEVDMSQELAQAAYKVHDYMRAQKLYEHRIDQSIEPLEKARNYHNLGNALMKQQKYSEAIAAYRESIRLNPTSEKTRHNLWEATKQRKREASSKNATSDAQQTDLQCASEQQKSGDQQQLADSQHQTPNSSQQSHTQSKLERKLIEKQLDELAKQEIQTKEQMNRSRSDLRSTKTKKDW